MTKPKINLVLLTLIINIFHDSFAKTDRCTLADSVDLTDYEKFPNGSYSYEGLIIPPHLLLEGSEYTIKDLSVEIPVKPHTRGCICELRPCAKLCCPPNKKSNQMNCVSSKRNPNLPTVINITTSSGELREVDVTKKFSIQYGRTCSLMFNLEPLQYSGDAFHLFENGTLLLKKRQKYLSKDKFCLNEQEETINKYILTPMICGIVASPGSSGTAMLVFNSISMLISVIFIILTIIVYMAIPELRTLHGKSLCCYLLGLCVGYTILSLNTLIPKFPCGKLGYLAYFSFMASFFWLSVISFDLFYNISAPRRRSNEKKRFILYSIYAWGLAFILLCLTFAAQQSSLVPKAWKPGMGYDGWCWLKMKYGWSAMIYFHGPFAIIIVFNIIMFVLTARKILSVQKEMSQMIEKQNSQRSICNEKEKFGIFLRLFIVMGVTWSMETTAYLVGQNSPWNKVLYITTFFNLTQGLTIFILFVLKKKVIRLITKRFLSTCYPESEFQSQDSNKTTFVSTTNK